MRQKEIWCNTLLILTRAALILYFASAANTLSPKDTARGDMLHRKVQFLSNHFATISALQLLCRNSAWSSLHDVRATYFFLGGPEIVFECLYRTAELVEK